MRPTRGGSARRTPTTPRSSPRRLIPKAILEGTCEWCGNEQEMAPRRTSSSTTSTRPTAARKIHMIWTDSPSWITCWNDGNTYVKAVRHPDIEFMLAQHPWLENDCLFADVILPVNTKLEEDDIGTDIFGGQMNLLFPEPRCIEPLGESFSDYEIVCMIAERLGLLEEYTDGKSIPELIKIGYETSGAAHLISWEELQEKGYYVIPHRSRTGRRSPPA